MECLSSNQITLPIIPYAMKEMWADGMVNLYLLAEGTNHVEEGENATWSHRPLYYACKMTRTL